MSVYVNGLFLGTLEPSDTVAGCVDIFKNVWPDPEQTIKNIEDECSNDSSNITWQISQTADYDENQEFRIGNTINITDLAISGNYLCQNINNQFYTLILASAIPYAQKHSIGQMYHENYSMIKYGVGGKYDAHSDHIPGHNRCFTAICYLNNDYDGGEIEFINFKIKIKPEPGMLLLFPSNYAYSHIAHPIKSGTKYALLASIKDYIE